MESSSALRLEPHWRRQAERQEHWTRALRSQLYRRVNLWAQGRVLDVGCGEGAVAAEMASRCRGQVAGVESDCRLLEYARRRGVQVAAGEGHWLPFPDEAFGVVACHMALLWAEEPGRVVIEMARVTAPGGVVMAMAEPDYGGRIDYPEDLTVGALMAQTLRKTGAHPRVGRRLREMFVNAGLAVEVGIINSLWNDPEHLRREFEADWSLLEATAEDLVAPGELEAMKRRDLQALDDGIRTVFMPIFWAVGRKGQ